ncbi:aldose 1-epimerase family protein [Gillisia sp. M10.2A]|uniref:Aldose 1-epimerase family protein n=1 Tax=Gillisia lutea TaxID=2909668 RepID=A0ABS9EHT4_9FLAO|nr:aldose 1-epimerase family protein [Gillisia lutea]MCF4101310.1 aldose 1-epimerase family protein [Gillisia lutea]
MQVHKIENDKLSIEVKTAGAELCSIKNKETGLEYIWQGDPEVWNSHAPVLFPIVGGLKEDRFQFEGNWFEMPRHGIFRRNPEVSLKSSDDSTLCFSLRSSEASLKKYPFKFEFEVTFELEESQLKISHEVTNLDVNPLYFSVGGHPAFNAPLYDGEEYSEYYLEFDRPITVNTHVLDKDGLVTNKTLPVLKNESQLKLHKNLFDKDALIFKNITSKQVALKSKQHGLILNVSYEDFQHLGIWAKPKAPYVCIEPWLGIADSSNTNQDLKTKEGINKLMPSHKFTAAYTITIA